MVGKRRVWYFPKYVLSTQRLKHFLNLQAEDTAGSAIVAKDLKSLACPTFSRNGNEQNFPLLDVLLGLYDCHNK